MKRKIFTLLGFLMMSGLVFTGCDRDRESAKVDKPGIICDFEDIKVWDISPESGFDISLSKEQLTEGEHSLKVVYPVGSYPSINTRKLTHAWGDYDSFCFDVFNLQNEKVNFVIRLDDETSKRVNIDYPLESGWNKVRIPKSQIAREINADNISFVVLFLDHPDKRITLYFGNMRLEKQKINIDKSTANDVSKSETSMAGLSDTETAGKIEIESKALQISPEWFEENKLPSKGALRVAVTKLRDEEKSKVLVSNGIPFGPGQLTSERDISIFDDNGNEIPIATKVLARWPHDNSIRSLLVQFPFAIKKKYEMVNIKWGKPRTTQDISLVEVNWEFPEGFIILPANWLCSSRIIGEQIPMGRDSFKGYDQNITRCYPRLRVTPKTKDVVEDCYYDIAHVFYQLYVRSGDEEYFKSARKEAVYYRDGFVIQEGPDKGRVVSKKETRYIYVQAMVDDYLLTGDNKSLVVAGYMAEYLKNNFAPSKAFYPKNATYFWTEREAAFPFLGILAYYELTGEKEYLKLAQEIMINLYRTQNEWSDRGGFIHNLYAHDPEEGARRDEYGGSPFMTGLLLEAIVKYHQFTNSEIAKDSIFKALDWLMKEATASGGNTFVYLTFENKKDMGHPDLNLLIAHAFGYGYKISGYTRTDYLELGMKIFEHGVNSAYLGDKKHFNQNYRSSGHFLSYINTK